MDPDPGKSSGSIRNRIRNTGIMDMMLCACSSPRVRMTRISVTDLLGEEEVEVETASDFKWLQRSVRDKHIHNIISPL